MAYWYDDTSPVDKTTRRCVNFIIDSNTDVADLPTSTTEGTPQPSDSTLHHKVSKGSTALSIGDSSFFMLNSQDNWVEM